MKIPCPHCDRNLEVADELIGRMSSCPECGKPLFVPNPGNLEAPQAGRPPKPRPQLIAPAAPRAVKVAPQQRPAGKLQLGVTSPYQLGRMSGGGFGTYLVVGLVVVSTHRAAGWTTDGVRNELVSKINGIETWRAHYRQAATERILFRLRVTETVEALDPWLFQTPLIHSLPPAGW